VDHDHGLADGRESSLYGAKIPSCGWEILMNDAAETIAAQNARIAARRYR